MGSNRLEVTISANASQAKRELSEFTSFLKTSFAGIAGAIGVGAIGATFRAIVSSSIEAGKAISDNAKRWQISVQAMQEFQVMAKLTGTEVESFGMAFKKMAKTIVDASNGNKTAEKTLRDLGLSYRDLLKMSAEQQFRAVASALAGITNGTERAAMANDIWGRTYQKLLPMISNGVKGFESLAASSGKIATASNRNIQTLEDIHHQLELLGVSSERAGMEFVAAMGPSLQRILSDLLTIIEELRKSGKLEEWGKAAGEGLETAYKAAKQLFDLIRDNKGLIEALAVLYGAKQAAGIVTGIAGTAGGFINRATSSAAGQAGTSAAGGVIVGSSAARGVAMFGGKALPVGVGSSAARGVAMFAGKELAVGVGSSAAGAEAALPVGVGSSAAGAEAMSYGGKLIASGAGGAVGVGGTTATGLIAAGAAWTVIMGGIILDMTLYYKLLKEIGNEEEARARFGKSAAGVPFTRNEIDEARFTRATGKTVTPENEEEFFKWQTANAPKKPSAVPGALSDLNVATLLTQHGVTAPDLSFDQTGPMAVGSFSQRQAALEKYKKSIDAAKKSVAGVNSAPGNLYQFPQEDIDKTIKALDEQQAKAEAALEAYRVEYCDREAKQWEEFKKAIAEARNKVAIDEEAEPGTARKFFAKLFEDDKKLFDEALRRGNGNAQLGVEIIAKEAETVQKTAQKLADLTKERNKLIDTTDHDTRVNALRERMQANEDRLTKQDNAFDKVMKKLGGEGIGDDALDRKLRLNALRLNAQGERVTVRTKALGLVMSPHDRHAWEKQQKEDAQYQEKLRLIEAGKNPHLTHKERMRLRYDDSLLGEARKDKADIEKTRKEREGLEKEQRAGIDKDAKADIKRSADSLDVIKKKIDHLPGRTA